MASGLVNAFNAGEFSPTLEGRVDFPRYHHACRRMENFVPLVQGGALKRSGTGFSWFARDRTTRSRVIRFQFNTEIVYALEFSHQNMRIHVQGGGTVTDLSAAITSISIGNPALVTTGAAHGFSNGNRVAFSDTGGVLQLRNREFSVQGATATTFMLYEIDGSTPVDTTTMDAYVTGGTVARIIDVATPYTTAQLDGITHVQSADILYLVHADVPEQEVRRTSPTLWTCAPLSYDWPPFGPDGDDDIRVYVRFAGAADDIDEVTPGDSVTVIASSALFGPGDVGRLLQLACTPEAVYALYISGPSGGNAIGLDDEVQFEGNVYRRTTGGGAGPGDTPPVHREYGEVRNARPTVPGSGPYLEYLHSGAGYVVITAYTSATEVTAEVVKQIPSACVGINGNPPQVNGVDETRGLSWAWAAFDEVGGYPSAVTFHEDRLMFGGSRAQPQVMVASASGDYYNFERWNADDAGLLLPLNAAQVNGIVWMFSDQQLLFGTTGGEFVTRTPNDEALTRANAKARRQSGYGTIAASRVLDAEDAILFVQKSGRKVREFIFDDVQQRYHGRDLTIAAEHITKGIVRWMAYASEPLRTVWVSLEDGQLIALTYERDEEVVAWHRHVLGGDDVSVESVDVIPRADGTDELWMCVGRTVGGQTLYTIEYMFPEFDENDEVADAKFLDSAITHDGAPITELTGLWHWNGETLSVFADGLRVPDAVVVDGKIELPAAASQVIVGYPYVAVLQTLRREAGTRDPTTGRVQALGPLNLRVERTGEGIYVGPDEENLDFLAVRQPSHPLGVETLYSGDLGPVPWPGGASREASALMFKHDSPLPCTLLYLAPEFTQPGDR